MPATKKHTSVRRRTNKASTAAILEPREDGEVVEIPELPPRRVTVRLEDGSTVRQDLEWLPETLEWWEAVWMTPTSDEYLESHLHGLFRLAILVDLYNESPSAKTHAEVRLAQKDYGLTPYDMRRLEWTIATSKKATAGGNGVTPTVAAGAQQPDPTTDPRLTLVK